MANKSDLSKELKRRIQRVSTALKKHSGKAALIVSSGVAKSSSRDLHHPFIQDSDFFYLTGSHQLENSSLIITAKKDTYLLAPSISDKELLWEGPRETAKQVSRRIGASLVTTEKPLNSFREILDDADHIFYPNTSGQAGYDFARTVLATPSHKRPKAPVALTHSDAILESLRLLKSPYEISLMKKAAEITAKSMDEITPYLIPGITEYEMATRIEAAFSIHGGGTAFPTIVGSGKNGATLHHTPSKQKLKNGDLVLIDCGARFEGYAADITRVFPVGDKTPAKALKLIELVTEVEESIIKKIKPGVRWLGLYEQASELLLKGLIDLRVLSGAFRTLKKKEVIKKYFPHSLGHTLGIDVHDIGPLRALKDTKLEAGMVLTIEPGLYFPKGIRALPACGVRIEDDVLVTSKGSQVLTERVSKFR